MILGKTTLESKFCAASYYVTKISQEETQVFRTITIQRTAYTSAPKLCHHLLSLSASKLDSDPRIRIILNLYFVLFYYLQYVAKDFGAFKR